MFAGDRLAQVVSCPWIMRDSGGSLAQNHWQGDLGLPAGRQDNAGGGRDVYSVLPAKKSNHKWHRKLCVKTIERWKICHGEGHEVLNVLAKA